MQNYITDSDQSKICKRRHQHKKSNHTKQEKHLSLKTADSLKRANIIEPLQPQNSIFYKQQGVGSIQSLSTCTERLVKHNAPQSLQKYPTKPPKSPKHSVMNNDEYELMNFEKIYKMRKKQSSKQHSKHSKQKVQKHIFQQQKNNQHTHENKKLNNNQIQYQKQLLYNNDSTTLGHKKSSSASASALSLSSYHCQNDINQILSKNQKQIKYLTKKLYQINKRMQISQIMSDISSQQANVLKAQIDYLLRMNHINKNHNQHQHQHQHQHQCQRQNSSLIMQKHINCQRLKNPKLSSKHIKVFNNYYQPNNLQQQQLQQDLKKDQYLQYYYQCGQKNKSKSKHSCCSNVDSNKNNNQHKKVANNKQEQQTSFFSKRKSFERKLRQKLLKLSRLKRQSQQIKKQQLKAKEMFNLKYDIQPKSMKQKIFYHTESSDTGSVFLPEQRDNDNMMMIKDDNSYGFGSRKTKLCKLKSTPHLADPLNYDSIHSLSKQSKKRNKVKKVQSRYSFLVDESSRTSSIENLKQDRKVEKTTKQLIIHENSIESNINKPQLKKIKNSSYQYQMPSGPSGSCQQNDMPMSSLTKQFDDLVIQEGIQTNSVRKNKIRNEIFRVSGEIKRLSESPQVGREPSQPRMSYKTPHKGKKHKAQKKNIIQQNQL